MAAPATVNVCKINASNITFSEVKKNKQGGGSVSFKYTNQNVQFRFPQFMFPGGVLVKDNQNKDGSVTTSYTMSASLHGCDPYGAEPAAGADDVQKAYNFLREFQESVIKAAVDNSPKWFGKKREIGSIRDSFNKFLSVSVDNTAEGWVPNGKYPPSLKFKLPVYDGKVCTDIIDDAENDVILKSPTELPDAFGKGCSAKIIAQGSIYIIGQAFGLTWKPSFVQVSKRRKQTARDLFREDQDDGETTAAPPAGSARAAFAAADDDDDDAAPKAGAGAGAGAGAADDDDDEVGYGGVVEPPASAPAPAPAPAPASAAAPRRRKVA
uniref:Uncharacterized protein n=1 Tax=viral metagenome TaxID=1070528 RepID=A0A6C0HKK5_9ZZZZ